MQFRNLMYKSLALLHIQKSWIHYSDHHCLNEGVCVLLLIVFCVSWCTSTCAVAHIQCV